MRVLLHRKTTGSMTDLFEQDLFVRLVRDPTAVIDDPLIELPTGEDRRFLFLVEEMAKEEVPGTVPGCGHGGRGSVALDGVVRG